MTNLEQISVDILIVGAGGAGLMAALHVRSRAPGLRLAIAVKGLLGQSGCTRMVQGGYNAVLNPADSLQRHFEDTVRGGAFLNDQELAWILVSEAPERIIELENRVGCWFDRNADGSIHQKPFAGQSFDRTVHRGDLTGIEIMSNLRDHILEQECRILEEVRALDLLLTGQRVTGALLLDIRSGRMIVVQARAVLLATGGGANMYRISSPSLEKSADGMAMALRASAELTDMEMMQFHPTGLLVGRSVATGGLLEEGLRGAGARLYNGLGERYMERYAPDRLERATRDLISRSSYLEIAAGRGTEAGGVWLDASHLGERFLMENFPGMVERCRDYGFDLLHDRVEVSPSAHYHMGGVRIGPDCRSSLEGLFVAGEDAGGVHGANRLGGNGVADSIVFGARAGNAMSEWVPGVAERRPSEAQVLELVESWERPLRREQGEDAFELRRQLEDLMWDKVGVVRNGPDLERALRALESLSDRSDSLAAPGNRAFSAAWNESLNLINLVAVAQMVTKSALIRRESRGAHFRSDYPDPNPLWLKHVFLQRHQEGCRDWAEPVQFTRLSPPGREAGGAALGAMEGGR